MKKQKKGHSYRPVTSPVRRMSPKELASKNYVTFKSGSFMMLSSNITITADIKSGDAFEVFVDEKKKAMKLVRILNGKPEEVSNTVLVASKMGGTGPKGQRRLRFSCRPLLKRLGITHDRLFCSAMPLTNGFEVKYETEE